MKKLLAILLALAVVGGVAFAQVTVAATASGGLTIFDQDASAVFARDGSGYDVLTFKASKDKTSFAFNVDNWDSFANGTGGNFLIRDWNFTTSNDWGKFIVGKVRNGDFRSSMAYGYYAKVGATRRFFGGAAYGMLFETTGLGDLTLGLGLPITETAADTVAVLEKSNIGVKYAIKDFGTVKALAELNFTSGGKSRFAASADITGVKDLAANVYFMFDTNGNGLYVAGNAYYTMDKLAINLEAEYLMDWATFNGPTVGLKAIYTLSDPLSVFAKAGLDIAGDFHVWAGADYDFVPGLTAEVEAGYSAGAVKYDVSCYYSLSF